MLDLISATMQATNELIPGQPEFATLDFVWPWIAIKLREVTNAMLEGE